MNKLIEKVNFVLREAVKPNLRHAFRSQVPHWPETRDGWFGDGIVHTPDGDIRRGRGYALVMLPADLLAEMQDDAKEFTRYVAGRIDRAAAHLGEALAARLAGQGVERHFYEGLQDEARRTGEAIAIAEVKPLPQGRAGYFYHLGDLPHLRDDDGTIASRDSETDQFVVLVRFFGNMVPLPAEKAEVA